MGMGWMATTVTVTDMYFVFANGIVAMSWAPNFSPHNLAWELSLGSLRLGTLALELRLETFGWSVSLPLSQAGESLAVIGGAG